MESIDVGRKGLAVEGKTEEGLHLFSTGLSSALMVFKEVFVNVANDIETLILVEYAYLTEELRYCSSLEPGVFASMTAAVAGFDDALRALKTLQDAELYKAAETTYPHLPQYRHHGMPKDAFLVACIANYTRINNTLRTPGINSIEREVYEQRLKNMIAVQNAYHSWQEVALTS